ncbi:hypothetical protein UJ101_00127 [Flavobacteriaceae bacterium UJ101]|nr:hypothetical protein UJ101_00127 [Flavobacteriaceae bacterium UJ101]
MKYLTVVLGVVFLASCGHKDRKDGHHHGPEMHEERMDISVQERDSIHEERKKRMMDRLTEKLDLTEDQIRKIKELDASYSPQLKVLRTEMFESRKKHHQLMEEKKIKMKEILTPEQVQKLESMRKRRDHRKEDRDHKEKHDS